MPADLGDASSFFKEFDGLPSEMDGLLMVSHVAS